MKAAAGTAVSRHPETVHAPDEPTPVASKASPVKTPTKAAPPVARRAAQPAAIGGTASKSAEPADKSAVADEIEEDRSEEDRSEEDVAATEREPEQTVEAAPVAPPRPPQHGPMQIPRPMAKAEIFVEGDHVVYPTHGVGKVERIAIEEIAGHKLELIHITFEENRMTLRVPVAKARTAGLRKLATRKLFDEALAILKGRARIKRTMWSRRAQEYEAKINSGDPLAIAEVVRDLHRNAGQPDQSFSERQIYEAAMDRLAAELAALDKTDKSTAVTKLAEFLKTV